MTPPITVEQAISILRNYIVEKKLDLSGQYIRSAVLRFDDSPQRRGRFWEIIWDYSQPKLGRVYIFKVYLDGTVSETSTGP